MNLGTFDWYVVDGRHKSKGIHILTTQFDLISFSAEVYCHVENYGQTSALCALFFT